MKFIPSCFSDCCRIFSVAAIITSCQNEKVKDVAQAVRDSSASAVGVCEDIPSRFASKENAPAGMVWIPGGKVMMGTDEAEAYEPEKPAHPVQVRGFFMDVTEVTNNQYKKFVDATGYITVAEQTPKWEELRKQLPPGTDPPAASDMVPA